MDNRTAFLNTIAQALGRPPRFEPQADAHRLTIMPTSA